MGVDDGVPIHYNLAEILVRATDRLHCTHEHENVDIEKDIMKESLGGTTY